MVYVSTATFHNEPRAHWDDFGHDSLERAEWSEYGGGDASFWKLRDDQSPLGFSLRAENKSRYHGNQEFVHTIRWALGCSGAVHATEV